MTPLYGGLTGKFRLLVTNAQPLIFSVAKVSRQTIIDGLPVTEKIVNGATFSGTASATIAGLLLIQNGLQLRKMSLGLFGITLQLPRSFFGDVIG